MILNISKGNSNVIERGVYYYGLSDYPHITTWDLKNVIAFVKYEKSHGRETKIECQDESLLIAVKNAISNPEIIESTATPAGEYGFVYHATDIKAAQNILSGGKLLSAEKVYGKCGEELSIEKSDSLWNDPADYFKYIMFCWGDNLTGDYVVLSSDFPTEGSLSMGNFNAGIRFYFRYEDITNHPGCTFDGYHAVKVKDEIDLCDYLYACIVPKQFENDLADFALPELESRVHYISQKGVGLNEWNDNIYDFVKRL